MKEEKKLNSESGLPDIAQMATKKNVFVLLVIAIVVISFIGMYLRTNKEMKQEKQNDENYTMQSSTQVDNQIEQPKVVAQPVPTHQITQEEVTYVQEKKKELQHRLSAPLVVINNTAADKVESQPGTKKVKDPNMQFLNQVSNQTTGAAMASNIGPLNTIIAEGNLIHATLESATNSDLPGFLRASVSDPVYSEDGSRILIPVGSRLIGQYKSGILQGQSRIFIAWTRLITPEGLSVNLGSAGVDVLGVAGIGADDINRHFWERFGTASLLSLIGAGTSNLGVSGIDQQNSSSAYREAIASSFSQSANQSLQQESMIAPTLKTDQGKPIVVFVARDLHFSSVLNNSQPNNLNIF